MLNIESEFIFQESLKKEFLEHNNKVEGPILESKEEFDNSHLKMSKVSNIEWIKENKNKYIVSLNAIHDYNLSLLKSYQFRILAQDETIRFDSKDFDEETFDKISIFDSIMYGIGGAHGLSYDDRRFYYDPLYSKLEPIYYDGNINILSKINYDGNSGKFKNKLKNWQIIDEPFLDIYLNKDRSLKNRHRNPTVTNSAKLGANRSIIILNNIDKNKLLETLHSNGLNDITIKKLNTLIQHIVVRLKSISNANVYKDNIQLDNSLYHKYKDEMKIEKNLNLFFINSQTKLSDEKNIFVEKCNYSLETCFSYLVNEKKLLDLIEQKAGKKVKNIFINADKNNYRDAKIKKSKNNIRNNFKKYKINESFEIFYNEDVEILLDKKKKIINIEYLGIQGRAIIFNSKIDKWSIKMQNLSINPGNNFENIYNLTGCLTIIDSTLNKVNITGENFDCEDTVIFIRSSGSLNEIFIKNSRSDSVDADFSKLKFFSINISNSKNDCIDFSYGTYIVDSADLQNCADKAISIGEKSIANFDTIKTQDSNIGIAVKDSSKVYINKAIMNRLDTCLSSYKKKQEFNGSYLEVNDFVCDTFINKFISDNKSNIVIKNEL